MREGRFRPIAFFGTVLSDTEKNFTVTEREGLGVVRALVNFSDMLVGAEIIVCTDDKLLITLLESAYKAPYARLRRWALYLTDFNVSYRYVPGKEHYMADYLSCSQEGDPPTEECLPSLGPELATMVTLPTGDLELDKILQEQRQDEMCSQLYDYLEHRKLPDDQKEAKFIVAHADSMLIIDPGIVSHLPTTKRYSKSETAPFRPHMVVPQSLVPTVLQRLRYDILAGAHLGKAAIYEKVSQDFYWPNMERDIMEYVRSCLKVRPEKACTPLQG